MEGPIGLLATGLAIFVGTVTGLGLGAVIVYVVGLVMMAPGERDARRREREERALDRRRRYWEGNRP